MADTISPGLHGNERDENMGLASSLGKNFKKPRRYLNKGDGKSFSRFRPVLAKPVGKPLATG